MVNKDGVSDFRTVLKDHNRFPRSINVIMNMHSFRKLAGKTQVILSLIGPAVRTRLTHTVEVARIARDICQELELTADLAEAIALAHDLGHTPFGHVGERTLKEIMCGCDTLDEKVLDLDFDNSGFKHNLQSFRVLKDIERIAGNGPEWSYIMWGVIDHTKPTYARVGTAKDNEIYISCGHCKDVYNCYFDKASHKCKRNQLNGFSYKKDAICKPWNCSDIKELDLNHLQELTALEKQQVSDSKSSAKILSERIIRLKKNWVNTYCDQPCYLAKLWKYKKDNENYQNFIYLFDHPFPNSFYSKHFNEFFFPGSFKDCISFEGQIVKRADEIAQRQEDLEDGLTKGLISREEAKKQISDLINGFRDHAAISKLNEELERIDDKSPEFQTQMGALLVKFYKKLIVHSTQNNVRKKFWPQKISRELISYYCLLDIVNAISGNKRSEWLIYEMKSFAMNSERKYRQLLHRNTIFLKKVFNAYFTEIIPYEAYLYFLIHSNIEKELKLHSISKLSAVFEMADLFCKLLSEKSRYRKSYNKLIRKKLATREVLAKDKVARLIFDLDVIKEHFLISYRNQYRNYKKRNAPWKELIQLNLKVFNQLHLFGRIQNRACLFSSNLKRIGVKNHKRSITEIYSLWKEAVRMQGNQALSNIVNLLEIDDSQVRYDCLKTFKNLQADTILKSESVEKNDGKATFILKRLFEAYITNPHQLPDYSLRNILIALVERKREFAGAVSATFEELILLKKALTAYLEINKKYSHEDLIKLSNDLARTLRSIISAMLIVPMKTTRRMIDNIVDEGVRMELKEIATIIQEDMALIRRRANSRNNGKVSTLAKLLKQYIDYKKEINKRRFPVEINELFLKRKNLECFVYSILKKYLLCNDKYANRQIKVFRGIIDNAILNAIPLWKSILTRGICDYIAGLTDQDAINEYEKLYAGIMELV